jgi:type 1 glutamine amidotransferase
VLKRILAVLVPVVVIVSGAPAEGAGLRALVYTRTSGFRHTSIDEAVAALQSIATERGIEAVHTEDPAAFSDAELGSYDVVVFLLTSGDVLAPGEQEALQRFVRSGGGFLGVHSASDTERDWPWYGRLVGAYSIGHPAVQPGVVRVTDRRHPSTAVVPARWARTDEWYDFDRNPRQNVHVLAGLSEASYQGGRMGSDHPIAWCHRFEGGRSWYTAMGHTEESYAEPDFRALLGGGLAWATGMRPGNCSPRTDLEVVTIRFDPQAGNLDGSVFTDRRSCLARRPIVVTRVRPGPDPVVARDRTDQSGAWSRPFAGRVGSFRAVARADGSCGALRSGTIALA